MHRVVIKRVAALAAWVVAAAAAVLVTAGPAFADHQVCDTNPVTGTVTCWVVHDPPPAKDGGGGSATAEKCRTNGRAIPCSIPGDGIWDTTHQCYTSVMNPPPPFSAAIWDGHTTGVIMRCTGGQGAGFFWSPNAGAGPPPAAVLAQRAVSMLQLPMMSASSNAGTGPAATTYVGVPTWLWLPLGQWHSLRSPPAAAARESVVATAVPVSVLWSMGDGGSTSCAGPGQPYSAADPSTPPCGYTYRIDSSRQPQRGPSVNDRYFMVRATVSWTISWTCTGAACDENGGDLPNLTRQTAPMPLRVFQVETVVTGGN